MIRPRCNGVELRVEVIGAGPPIVLIMGLGASLETWVAQREAFAARNQVEAILDHARCRGYTPCVRRRSCSRRQRTC
jgi:hypothetical protein